MTSSADDPDLVAARMTSPAEDILRTRESRREQTLEPSHVHIPDPIVSNAAGMDPEHEALLADSVGLALLVILETLPPAERLAFVLHDMFAVPFDEIAPIVDRSPAAARQLASRGRRRRLRGPAGGARSRRRAARRRRRASPVPPAGGSSRSTCSPIPSACRRSISQCCETPLRMLTTPRTSPRR
jgi:hypothetical protein